MRQLKSIFTLILALSLPSLVAAEQSSGGSKPRPPVILHKGHGHSLGNYPKAPDRQSITCSYDGMIIDNSRITVSSMITGSVIASTSMTGGESHASISMPNFNDGLYIVSYLVDDVVIDSRKITCDR